MTSHSSDSGSSPKRLRRPPDYFARSTKLRLFMLVGLLFFIVTMIYRAADPVNWHYFGLGEKPAAAPAAREEEIDTRLARRPEQLESLPGTVTATTFQWRPEGPIDDETAVRQREERKIWEAQFSQLSRDERRNMPLVLKHFRDGQPLTAEQRKLWEESVAQFDENWLGYIAQANEALQSDAYRSDEDKGAWLLLLHQLQKEWTESLHPAMEALKDPPSMTTAQRATIDQFQKFFDEMSIAAVRDDTVISRPEEVNAWFRLFELLQQSTDKQLAEAAAPDVGFRQLFKQSADYRGELVRLSGRVRMAYRVQAPKNYLGIKEYYVLWVLPDGGPSSPVEVYALEMPKDFPFIADKDIDRETTRLDEPIDVTGFFLKRAAYVAQDGSRVTPVVLARAPIWKQEAVKAELKFPAPWIIALVVGGLAVLSIVMAYRVYTNSKKLHDAAQWMPQSRVKPQQMKQLENENVGPSPSEALRHLEQRDRAASSESSPPSSSTEADKPLK